MSTYRRSADQWFAEYGESHQSRVNELIHWVCVPVIFFSVMGLVASIPVPAALTSVAPWFNWIQPVAVLVLMFYVRLSPALAIGMLGFMSFCYLALEWHAAACPVAMWKSSLALFVLAWAGQFIGHKIEGKKPSFFKDVQFLLIGPVWLMHFVYRKLNVAY
jgi:uncharacterized membrane protein YGL010W